MNTIILDVFLYHGYLAILRFVLLGLRLNEELLVTPAAPAGGQNTQPRVITVVGRVGAVPHNFYLLQ